MKMHIEKINCKWVVNGKPINEMNDMESKFMNDFFREMKIKDSYLIKTN